MNNKIYLTLNILSAILLSLYFYSDADQSVIPLALASINFGSLYGFYRATEATEKPNPFERIQLFNGKLRIDGKLIDEGELKTVVINKVDGAGIFLTPQDESITRGFIFDASYVNKLSKWFRVYAPSVKVTKVV